MPAAPIPEKPLLSTWLVKMPPTLRVVLLLLLMAIFAVLHLAMPERETSLHVLAYILVALGGLLMGIWGGLVCFGSLFLFEVLALHPFAVVSPAQHGDRWVVYGGMLLTGVVVGGLRKLFLQLQTELAQRAQVEAYLRAQEDTYHSVMTRARRQAQELTLLDQVHRALAPEVDLGAIYHKVVEITAEVFSYPLVSIYEVQKDFLVLCHQVGYAKLIERIPLGQGVISRCVRTARPVLVRDTTTDPDFLRVMEEITTSEVAVPLFDEGRVVGVLNVETLQDANLGEADLRLLEQVAGYTSIAIGRARLYTAEREQRDLAEALHDNARALNRSLQMDDVATSILTNMGRVVPCDAAALVILESTGTRILTLRSDEDRVSSETSIPVNMQEVLRYLSKHESAFVVENTNNVPGWSSSGGMMWIRSLMVAPVWVKGQRVAMLFLGSAVTHHFHEAQLGRLQGLAEQAGAAIENARLFENLARSARQLTLLNEITGVALSATTLDEIYTGVIGRLVDLIGVDGAFITRWDETTNIPRPAASAGVLGKNYLKLHTQPGENTITAAVLATGKTIVVEDSHDTPYMSLRLAIQLDNRSVLGVPLVANGQKLGAVLLGFREKHVFTPEEVALYEQAAGQISLAINRLILIERIGQMAITDDLTGLLNYRGLQQFGQREVERALRFNRPLAALMIDLDRFKQVNDQYGHTAGNEVLREVARSIRVNVRDIDIVGRYGGEEFLVLLPESDMEEARQVAERIRQVVEALIVRAGQTQIHVTVSLGAAVVTPSVRDLTELVQRADQGLYRAKRGGRNQVAAYTRITSELKE